MAASVTVKGVVRGKTIELERAPGLPDGQEVTVTVEPAPAATTLPAGDGLRRSAGAWSDDAAGLEQYLQWTREQRKHTRREPAAVPTDEVETLDRALKEIERESKESVRREWGLP